MVGLPVMLKVTAGEGTSIVGGRSIQERELFNEKLDRETGDRAWLNSWLFNVSIYSLRVLATIYFVYNLFFCYTFIQIVLQIFSSDVFKFMTFLFHLEPVWYLHVVLIYVWFF